MSEADAASVALIDGEKVLLIQRAFEPFAGLWTLPGGRREPDEAIEDTATREIREEIGLEIYALRPVKQIAAGKYRLQVFAAQAFDGDVTPSPEISAWRWVRPGQLAALPKTPGLADVLERAFALFDRR